LSCPPSPASAKQPISSEQFCYSRKSNFEGFTHFNGSNQLSLTSAMLKDEIQYSAMNYHQYNQYGTAGMEYVYLASRN
jgi:hypothetical protein